MAMVRHTYNTDNPPPLSEESLLRMAALKDRPIDYSDIPKRTREELQRGRLLAIQKRAEQREKLMKKQMFSLRLQKGTIDWWKSLGSGYTGLMARLLDKTKEHPEWLEECLQD